MLLTTLLVQKKVELFKKAEKIKFYNNNNGTGTTIDNLGHLLPCHINPFFQYKPVRVVSA